MQDSAARCVAGLVDAQADASLHIPSSGLQVHSRTRVGRKRSFDCKPEEAPRLRTRARAAYGFVLRCREQLVVPFIPHRAAGPHAFRVSPVRGEAFARSPSPALRRAVGRARIQKSLCARRAWTKPLKHVGAKSKQSRQARRGVTRSTYRRASCRCCTRSPRAPVQAPYRRLCRQVPSPRAR